MYIHELQDWPRLTWSREQLAEPLAAVRHRQGRLLGHMEALGFKLRQEAELQTLMEVVSGPVGKEHVHFQAPAAAHLDKEMKAFLDWFNADSDIDPVLKAGLAHFWFVTIHPFDDGNGRIARAIADMALARSENSPQRFYSMSAQVQQDREAYYHILEETQKGTLDITDWIEWFLNCLDRAIDGAQTTLSAVLSKARFWEAIAGVAINERQRLVLNRLLDGFEGKLTTSKYARLAKCSQDTALRDILRLVERAILVRNSQGGRSTSYALATIFTVGDSQ